MPEQLFLGFDFGEKRIGVAIGNAISLEAKPLLVIDTEENKKRFSAIEALISEWQPDRLIVGLPLQEDGTDQPFTLRCRRFANQLHGRFSLPVSLIDERFSSEAAYWITRDRKKNDAVAASVILQDFLDSLQVV